MISRTNYSVVIPVYNSAKTLPELTARLLIVLRPLSNLLEIVFVDDSSRDDSWDVLKKIRAGNPEVKIVRLNKNFGQHSALLCGFHYAKGDYVITLDDDLQNPPEEIPKLISLIQPQELDVVIGVAKERKHARYRDWGSRLVSILMTWNFSLRPGLRISSFRIVKARVIRQLCKMPTKNPAIDAMIFSFVHPERIQNIEVRHEERSAGRSQYTIYKLFSLACNHVLNYSTFPLKVMNVTGLFSSFFGLSVAVFLIFKYFYFGVPVQGWTSLVVTLFFFFGLILFCLGMIGEYLIRIIREVNSSPIFVVREEEV